MIVSAWPDVLFGPRIRRDEHHGALNTHYMQCVFIHTNQIKSNHFYCHITTAQVPWWVKFLRACSRQCNKKQQFTYRQYIFTDCTEDNVQNTHTYTQYTQCTIKTYLVILDTRGLSPAESHTRIFLIWTNVKLSLYENSCIHRKKKTDEFGIAIATIYDLFVFFKSSPGNK